GRALAAGLAPLVGCAPAVAVACAARVLGECPLSSPPPQAESTNNRESRIVNGKRLRFPHIAVKSANSSDTSSTVYGATIAYEGGRRKEIEAARQQGGKAEGVEAIGDSRDDAFAALG